MIRFYPVPPYGDQVLLVTARRKPRGYVEFVRGCHEKLTVVSHYEAYRTSQPFTGWRPVGFNGQQGPIFIDKHQAAQRLCSEDKYWVAIGRDYYGKTWPPLIKKPTKPWLYAGAVLSKELIEEAFEIMKNAPVISLNGVKLVAP